MFLNLSLQITKSKLREDRALLQKPHRCAFRQGTDTFTTTSGYTQTIRQRTHIINGKSSCIHLLFTANNKLLSEVGVEQTI